MSLRYALLALLTAEPMTGYDITKQFADSVGHVWFARDSQIYPQLHRMEDDGLVVATDRSEGSRRRKREYRITDEGIASFRRWLEEPIGYQRGRDPAHLRAAYLEWTSPEAGRTLLLHHIDFHLEQIRRWKSIRSALASHTSPTLQARLRLEPAERHARVIAFKLFAYDGLITRAEAEVTWARTGLGLIDSHDAS